MKITLGGEHKCFRYSWTFWLLNIVLNSEFLKYLKILKISHNISATNRKICFSMKKKNRFTLRKEPMTSAIYYFFSIISYHLVGDKTGENSRMTIVSFLSLAYLVWDINYIIYPEWVMASFIWASYLTHFFWPPISQEITLKMKDLYIVNSLAFSMSCGATCLCCKLKAQQQQ